MFDAHCHLDLHPEPANSVWARAQAAGVTGAVVAGVGPAGWAAQARLASALPGIALTYGLHPWTVAAEGADLPALLDALRRQLEAAPVRPVGLGETGLDRGRRVPAASLPLQIAAFEAQLDLAARARLPVVLHVVAAHGLALETLRAADLSAGGMVHSWSGDPEMVKPTLDLGLHLSFSGSLLSSARLAEAARRVPLDRLLAETDAPDQRPRALGPGPGEPAELRGVLAGLSAARQQPLAEIEAATAANAIALFRLSALPITGGTG